MLTHSDNWNETLKKIKDPTLKTKYVTTRLGINLE